MAIEEWQQRLSESPRLTQQYQARHSIVGIVGRELTTKQLEEKPDDKCQKDLDFLISHYHTGTDFNLHDYLRENAERFQNALDAICFYTRTAYVSRVFAQLLKATKPNTRATKEINLTGRYVTLGDMLVEIFSLSPESLTQAGEYGGIEACTDILSCLSDDRIPLLALTSKRVAKASGPSGIIGKKTFYTFPTRIPNVDAKYLYDDKSESPEVSFVVKPF